MNNTHSPRKKVSGCCYNVEIIYFILEISSKVGIELCAPIMNIMSLYRENLTKADYDKYKEFMLYYSRTYPLLAIKTQNDADFHTLAGKL